MRVLPSPPSSETPECDSVFLVNKAILEESGSTFPSLPPLCRVSAFDGLSRTPALGFNRDRHLDAVLPAAGAKPHRRRTAGPQLGPTGSPVKGRSTGGTLETSCIRTEETHGDFRGVFSSLSKINAFSSGCRDTRTPHPLPDRRRSEIDRSSHKLVRRKPARDFCSKGVWNL